MILVDTSVWIDHLRKSDGELQTLLNAGQVLAHPFVIGELALGNLRQRDVVLDALQGLPQVSVATEEEVLRFIGQKTLYGIGIGYIDAHLLAALRLSPGSRLWTRDRRLLAAATRLGLSIRRAH
ncbi:type II toxin-antitoxin system VapC family toxin [Paralcaligenes sp. KSB-10]|uniref:type II toxin-antitoxin system VapC family toxin n=1 Tax=Paralcaligenes sp. KSB-10 TaxID=2901142 RepID=UPI001E2D8F5A|nr:type II toxin-antitoxin system VapC family toxin [Paralcaligenes sp. KSB-10]UHL63902.1 type II toxin-antitoxin system VapC family toxin [Paralcaligenes sp. KSB-10]